MKLLMQENAQLKKKLKDGQHVGFARQAHSAQKKRKKRFDVAQPTPRPLDARDEGAVGAFDE